MTGSPWCAVLCCEHLNVNTELFSAVRSPAVSVRWRRRPTLPQRIMGPVVLLGDSRGAEIPAVQRAYMITKSKLEYPAMVCD